MTKKYKLFVVVAILLGGCGTVSTSSTASQVSESNKAVLLLSNYSIFSLDGRVIDGKTKKLILDEGRHEVEMKLHVKNCSVFKGCWTHSSGLLSRVFTVEKGKAYRTVYKPGSKKGKFETLIVEDSTGVVVSENVSHSTKNNNSIDVSIYDLKNEVKVIGQATPTGTGRGVLRFSSTLGECEGDYVTNVSGYNLTSSSSAWGGIYKKGVFGEMSKQAEANISTNEKINIQPNTQHGTATVICSSKRLVSCEYVVSGGKHGSGFCESGGELIYKIIF